MEERRKDNQENSERILRLEILLEQQRLISENHQKHDDASFAILTDQVKASKDEILEILTPMQSTLQKLWDERNQQKGALLASKFIGTGVTAVVSGCIAFAVAWFKTGGAHELK